MTFDLFMLQEAFLEDVELEFFSRDEMVCVAVDFSGVDGSCGVCVSNSRLVNKHA